jgi:tRNA C32,U32 (ribose-2'-O)-methylase TrmJ
VESCSTPNTEYNIAQAAEVLYYIVMLQGFHEHLNLDFEPQPDIPSRATLLTYSKNIARLVHRRKFSEQDKLNFRQETAEHINNLMSALVGYSGRD